MYKTLKIDTYHVLFVVVRFCWLYSATVFVWSILLS